MMFDRRFVCNVDLLISALKSRLELTAKSVGPVSRHNSPADLFLEIGLRLLLLIVDLDEPGGLTRLLQRLSHNDADMLTEKLDLGVL